ncbi:hypothetical protein WKR98_02315 [Pigmentiphaga sp. YJ18]|uniref:hypothetical protein n=1 Tax=unclassified Pigmentiphaga TaxID=2626614 RepID=UPI00192DA2C9|nr:hypothetical protein [Pigmentiphaga sp. H8]
MENATSAGNSYVTSPALARANESPASAVSWAAIIAGAVIASAVSFMLLAGGAGLGFVSMSPWSGEGASATTLGIGAVVWMILTHIIAYGLGGYLAGRLRTKWVGIHTDETYFRDTAHGFLVWALSAVVSAMVVGSALMSAAAGTAKAGATIAAGTGAAATAAAGQAARTDAGGMPTDYVADLLLRGDQPNPAGDPGAARAEVGRIVAASVARGELNAEDRGYLARVVAAQTGADQATAEKRVDDIVTRARQAAQQAEQTARQAADTARKAAAAFALWAFASMLIGAFVASWMATVGGRSRDDIV